MATIVSDIEKLPEELLLEVASYLPLRDVLSVRAASPKHLAAPLFTRLAHRFFPELDMRPRHDGRDRHREEGLLAILRKSGDLASKVTSLHGRYSARNVQQEFFLDVLATLPCLQELCVDYLEMCSTDTSFAKKVLHRTPISSLAILDLERCEVSTSALQALFGYAPNLSSLRMRRVCCVDGWSKAFRIIGENDKITHVKLWEVLTTTRPSHYFPLAGEGHIVHRDDEERRPKFKNARVDGELQHYVLQTRGISHIKGRLAVKEVMEQLASVKVEECHCQQYDINI